MFLNLWNLTDKKHGFIRNGASSQTLVYSDENGHTPPRPYLNACFRHLILGAIVANFLYKLHLFAITFSVKTISIIFCRTVYILQLITLESHLRKKAFK